jgi:membrane-associated phospholipid phosphatase
MTRNWNLSRLLLLHLAAVLLFSTLFFSFTANYWETIDTATFQVLNGSLKGSHSWQVFWALANHKLADWVEDLFILGFCIAHVKSQPKERRARSIAELLFMILLIAATIVLINRIFFREVIRLPRESPTKILDGAILLSHVVPWLHTKIRASTCFPADHATTALLFAAIYAYFAKWRLGILSCLYAVFLCMPRLIAGAHWLSDVIVGSGTILLVVLSIAFCTPLHTKIIDRLERFFLSFSSRKLKEKIEEI